MKIFTHPKRTVQSGNQVLDENFCAQFCDGRGNRHSDGVSVWNQLGQIF